MAADVELPLVESICKSYWTDLGKYLENKSSATNYQLLKAAVQKCSVVITSVSACTQQMDVTFFERMKIQGGRYTVCYMLQAGRSRVQVPMRSLKFRKFTCFFQTHYSSAVYSPCNRNECRKVFLRVKRSRRVRLTSNRHQWLDCLDNVGSLKSQNPIGLRGLLQGDSFTLWRRSVLPVRYELDCKYCYK
jgi:hypothetical protein